MAMAASSKGRARFTVACGVLSQYIKQAAEKAAAAAAETDSSPAALVALPLMPGADVSTTTQEDQEPETPATTSCASQSQMTIVYGGRVLVLDDVPADKAAGLLQVAAAAARGGKTISTADMPVARKASLKKFMEKRKGRVAARAAPYLRVDDAVCTDSLELTL